MRHVVPVTVAITIPIAVSISTVEPARAVTPVALAVTPAVTQAFQIHSPPTPHRQAARRRRLRRQEHLLIPLRLVYHLHLTLVTFVRFQTTVLRLPIPSGLILMDLHIVAQIVILLLGVSTQAGAVVVVQYVGNGEVEGV